MRIRSSRCVVSCLEFRLSSKVDSSPFFVNEQSCIAFSKVGRIQIQNSFKTTSKNIWNHRQINSIHEFTSRLRDAKWGKMENTRTSTVIQCCDCEFFWVHRKAGNLGLNANQKMSKSRNGCHWQWGNKTRNHSEMKQIVHKNKQYYWHNWNFYKSKLNRQTTWSKERGQPR